MARSIAIQRALWDAQGIGKPCLGAARAQGLLLAFMRSPASKENKLERRGDPAIRRWEIRVIDRLGPGQNGAAGEVAGAGGKSVRLAHRAELGHQGRKVRIVHGLSHAVGYGQGKARALHQGTKVADFPHWQNARGKAAGNLCLGFGERGTQFLQGLTAEHDAQEKPVRLQRAAALDELAEGVICPVQGQRMDHKVLRAGGEGKGVLRIKNAGFRKPAPPEIGKSGDECVVRKPSVNLKQPFLKVICSQPVQEQRRLVSGVGPGAVALAGKSRKIDERRRQGHCRKDGGQTMGMQAALHLLYPPQCISCGVAVISDFGLCAECWRATPFISGLVCDQCGTPLQGTSGERLRCDDCLTIARPWERGRAALMYGDNARSLVLALKHGDRMDLARPAGSWMVKVAQPILKPGMLVVPVPLHWTRLLRRKYNQAALLSKAVARQASLAHCPDALSRRRPTGTQDGKTRDGRFANLVGAFVVSPRREAITQERDILLVDDVMTSGATFAAATDALFAAGARSVQVLSLARVAKDG